jgi:hypothetical protein
MINLKTLFVSHLLASQLRHALKAGFSIRKDEMKKHQVKK